MKLAFLERTLLGVDVGSFSAKFVEVRAGFRSIEVLRCAELLLPRGVPAEQAEAEIERFCDAERFSAEKTVTGLAGNRVTQRQLRFPFIGAKKVAEAIPAEIEEHIPVPLSSMVLAHELARTAKNPDLTDVLAVLAPRQEVREHLERHQRMGIDPAIVEAEGTSLGNLAHYLGMDGGARLLLDVGHRKTNLVLLVGAKPLLLRSISIAGFHFTEALAAELSLDFDAAEKYKHTHGVFKTGSLTPASARVGHLLDQLARETLRSLQALVGANEQVNPSEIVLLGGSAALEHLDTYLHQRTQLPCRPLSIPGTLEGSEALAGAEHPAVFAQAAAYALRGGYEPATTADFRQDEFKYVPDLTALRPQISWAIRLFVALLVVWPLSRGAEYLGESSRASALREQIVALHEQALPGVAVPPDDVMGSLEQEYQRAQETATHLGVTGAGTSPLELLREISARIPPELDVSLSRLRIEQFSIRARGIAPDFSAAGKVKAALEAPGTDGTPSVFSEVQITKSTRDRTGNVFELTIKLASGL